MEKGTFPGQENSEDVKGQDAHPRTTPLFHVSGSPSGSEFAVKAREGQASSALCYPVIRSWA